LTPHTQHAKRGGGGGSETEQGKPCCCNACLSRRMGRQRVVHASEVGSVVGGKGCVVGVVGGNRNKDKHAKGDKKEEVNLPTNTTHK